MRILKEQAIGLVIDIQERLFPHIAQNEALLANVKKLIEGLKILEVPVVVTEQYKKGLGNSLPDIVALTQGDVYLEKTAFSCCDDSNISKCLVDSGRKYVIMCGIESHICLLQTAVDLLEKGYWPVVVEDCVSSRKLSDKETAIRRLLAEGAIVTSTESILFELCRYASGDQFKAISKLIK